MMQRNAVILWSLTILWLGISALDLWFVAKGLNFLFEVGLILGFLLLPFWIQSPSTFFKFTWANFRVLQFMSWNAVLFAGICTMIAMRLKLRVVNSFSLEIDWSVPVLLISSSLILFLNEGWTRNLASYLEPARSLFDFPFQILTFSLILSQLYILWNYINGGNPVLWLSYPTLPFGLSIIYFIASCVWLIDRE